MVRHQRCEKWLIGALFFSLAIFTISDVAIAGVKDTAAEEATCKDIGFQPKTAGFADCVLELLSRKEARGQNAASSRSGHSRKNSGVAETRNAPDTSDSAVQVVLAPNEQSCAGYGFKKGTTHFAQCLMQLDEAQRRAELHQQQYNLQLAEYQQQVASYNAQQEALKRERQRRQGEVLMRMGEGMLNSRSPSLLGGIADGLAAVNGTPIQQPELPVPPTSQNYAVRMPDGNHVYCNFNATTSYLSCR